MNYTEDIIIPESPRVLAKEQFLLHAPLANNTTRGVASFHDENFIVIDGMVELKASYLIGLISKLSLSVTNGSTVNLLYDGNVISSAELK